MARKRKQDIRTIEEVKEVIKESVKEETKVESKKATKIEFNNIENFKYIVETYIDARLTSRKGFNDPDLASNYKELQLRLHRDEIGFNAVIKNQ